MITKIFSNYYNGENTYLLYDEETKNAVVIDPGFSGPEFDEFVSENNINLKYILLTHCHYDHISALPGLKEAYSLKTVCGEVCEKNLRNTDVNLTVSGLGYEICEYADVVLLDNEEFCLDGIKLKCIYTPGHTSGSVCYLAGDKLFSGDTLFFRSVGRSDLSTGNQQMLENSIRNRLFCLDNNIEVFPGHGDSTFIGYEKENNLYVRM